MGGYIVPSTPVASADESDGSGSANDTKDDDDATTSDDEDDGDASSSNSNDMSTWYSYPLSLVTLKGSIFGYESSHS